MTDNLPLEYEGRLAELLDLLFDDIGPSIALIADLPGLELLQANRHDPQALQALLKAQKTHWVGAAATFDQSVKVLDEAIELLTETSQCSPDTHA